MKRQYVYYSNDYIDWYFDGYHRDGDLPAHYYFRNGKIYSVVYCQHGLDHRATGPAYINYADKIKEYWYQDWCYDSLEEMQMVETCR